MLKLLLTIFIYTFAFSQESSESKQLLAKFCQNNSSQCNKNDFFDYAVVLSTLESECLSTKSKNNCSRFEDEFKKKGLQSIQCNASDICANDSKDDELKVNCYSDVLGKTFDAFIEIIKFPITFTEFVYSSFQSDKECFYDYSKKLLPIVQFNSMVPKDFQVSEDYFKTDGKGNLVGPVKDWSCNEIKKLIQVKNNKFHDYLADPKNRKKMEEYKNSNLFHSGIITAYQNKLSCLTRASKKKFICDFQTSLIAGVVSGAVVTKILKHATAKPAEIKIKFTSLKEQLKNYKNINWKNFEENPQLEIWRLKELNDLTAADKLREFVEIELAGGAIKSSRILTLHSVSMPYVVELENGIKGVWKPKEVFLNNGATEIAVYQIDKQLGANLVPITVERKLNGKDGTIQLFINNTDKTKLTSFPESLYFFDTLVNNTDRHRGNYFTINGRLIAIDHGISLGARNVPSRTFYNSKLDKDFIVPLTKEYLKLDAIKNQIEIFDYEAKILSATEKAKLDIKKAKLVDKMNKQLDIIRKKTIDAKPQLSVLLPERSTFEKLKSVSESEWKEVLQKSISKQEIDVFLSKRKEIIKTTDEAIILYGDSAFRDGAVSPLVRQPAIYDLFKRNQADKGIALKVADKAEEFVNSEQFLKILSKILENKRIDESFRRIREREMRR